LYRRKLRTGLSIYSPKYGGIANENDCSLGNTAQKKAVGVWYNRSMNKQITLPGITDELAQAATKKKEFLSQIDRIIPWNEWLELLKPRYYKRERGNKPYALEKMLRIYFV